MSVSLNAFSADPAEREWYKQHLIELGVFPSDENIPETVIYRLWAATAQLGRFRAEQLLNRMAGHFYKKHSGQPASISIHDVIGEYMSQQLRAAGRWEDTHRSLLRNYNENGQPWYTIEDDGYLYYHLVYHLQALDDVQELHSLFQDDRWLRARFEASGYLYGGFINDLITAWRDVAHKQVLEQIKTGKTPTELARCVRYALIRTSINSLSANYPPEPVAQTVKRRRMVTVSRTGTRGHHARARTAGRVVHSAVRR